MAAAPKADFIVVDYQLLREFGNLLNRKQFDNEGVSKCSGCSGCKNGTHGTWQFSVGSLYANFILTTDFARIFAAHYHSKNNPAAGPLGFCLMSLAALAR
jgi:hypothetical protein